MNRGSVICPIVILAVLAGTSTFFFMFQYNDIAPSKQSEPCYLRSVETGGGKVLNEIEPGSEAYYALSSTKKRLIEETNAVNEELQASILMSTKDSGSSGTITRALMGYLPPGEAKFTSELKWFYLSIGYMRVSQPPHIKTDLIIFTEPSFVDHIVSELNCLRDIRTSASNPEACIVLPHVRLKNRDVRPGNVKPPLTEYSNYVDSMLILAEFPSDSIYDYILRSDLDTFLTPGFSNWTLPDDILIATGAGGYGSENVNRHLSWTMREKLKLKDQGLIGLGSTWYGRSSIMINAAKLTIACMNWLHTQEFNEYEQFHAGVDGWPYWHWPVLLLYGGHIALNQIPVSKILRSTEGVMELDKGTASAAAMTHATKHLHCYHSEDFFSKFQFQALKYANRDITEYTSMNSTQSYAGVIAISSQRLSSQALATYVADTSSMERGDWKRLRP